MSKLINYKIEYEVPPFKTIMECQAEAKDEAMMKLWLKKNYPNWKILKLTPFKNRRKAKLQKEETE